MDYPLIFYILLLVVAFLYASVGHGGASGYLALMALFSISPDMMKPTALVLNLLVSLIAFIHFYKEKHFKWAIFWPLALGSVPLAFWGGTIHIDPILYKKILGVLLLFPIIRLLFFQGIEKTVQKPASLFPSLAMGSSIGFVSGLIGIGGGILLSPLLVLLRWTDQKQTAAISSLFIFVNSMAALTGQISSGVQLNYDMATLIIIAFIGGLIGSYFGAKRFPQNTLKYILALVLGIAALKLLIV